MSQSEKKYNDDEHYHEKGPVLVDDLRLSDRRSVIINDPVQLNNIRPRPQLTRYVDVSLSNRRRRVHTSQHHHIYTTQCVTECRTFPLDIPPGHIPPDKSPRTFPPAFRRSRTFPPWSMFENLLILSTLLIMIEQSENFLHISN